MESAKTVRKSCDLCYRRKMKCDGRKPRCSHCITYNVECTYAAPSRTHVPKKRRRHAESGDNSANTQNRLEELEILVQQVAGRLGAVEGTREAEQGPQHNEASTASAVVPPNITGHQDSRRSPKSMDLPPIDHALPLIHLYLQDFNSVLPLFHADSLLHLVQDCYNTEPLQRDPVAWAAINVVLALARRNSNVTNDEIPSSNVLISRAESVLSMVVLGDVQLLHIQVLVGTVMLLQASQYLKPATVLIATTIRLAHSIGLHDRTYPDQLDPSHVRQRAYVFWLAYILDKDLSMRAKLPSIQIDDDINIDLPSTMSLQYEMQRNNINEPEDAMGIISTIDGTAKLDYLTARIQLAAIEGGVFDYIYSTRSRKRSPEERSRALQSVSSALEKWKSSIPFEFRASASSKRVNPKVLRFIGALHSTSLTCTTLINQAHAWDVEWVDSIRKFDRHGVRPLLPPKWEALVDEARDLLLLFGAIGETDRSDFGTIGCSYMTSMMLLTANSMYRLRHENLFLDGHLVEIGLQKVSKMVNETADNEMLRWFQATCTELHQSTQKRCAEAVTMGQGSERSIVTVNN